MKNKKAFTLVELLIVISILAVLSAVSVVGYSAFTKKASLSNDTTLVEQWNTLLAAKEVIEEESQTIEAVRSLFKSEGTNDFVPESKGYHFYWYENEIFLVEDADNNFNIVFPDEDIIIAEDKRVRLDEESGNNGGLCLSAGTSMTMADYSNKNIEDIVEGDKVLTINHELGILEEQSVYFVWKCSQPKTPFVLNFSNGSQLSIVGDHCLFEQESLSYVSIYEHNADEFIGNHFYNALCNEYVELVNVTYSSTPVEYYEIYTEYNFNCIAEGMLNAPLDNAMFLNIYEFNDDLSVDLEQLQLDLDKYGIYEYNSDDPYSNDLYDIQKMKYINIVVGKGLSTIEQLQSYRDEYINYIQK